MWPTEKLYAEGDYFIILLCAGPLSRLSYNQKNKMYYDWNTTMPGLCYVTLHKLKIAFEACLRSIRTILLWPRRHRMATFSPCVLFYAVSNKVYYPLSMNTGKPEKSNATRNP